MKSNQNTTKIVRIKGPILEMVEQLKKYRGLTRDGAVVEYAIAEMYHKMKQDEK